MKTSTVERMVRGVLFVTLTLLLGTFNVQAQEPAEASWSFIVRTNGSFRGVLALLDENGVPAIPSVACRRTLYGVVQSNRGESRVVRLASRRGVRATTLFRTRGLPAVRLLRSGELAKLDIMARVRCGDQIIDSNVFARYIRCGEGRAFPGTERVGPIRWVRALRAGLRRGRR